MDFKQITLDFIEGRMAPKDYDALLMAESALNEYLQGLIPMDETTHVRDYTKMEILLQSLPEEEYREIMAIKMYLEDRQAADRLETANQLVKAILKAGERIPDFPDYIPMVLGKLPLIIADRDSYKESFIQLIPDSVLDNFEEDLLVMREVKQTVQTMIGNCMHYNEKNRGTLGYYLNLHSAVTRYYTLAYPGEKVEKDESLSEKFGLMLDICPDYIGGTEVEEAGILEKIIAEAPQDMPKTKRIKLLKEKVKQAFHIEARLRPYWIQDPEWPVNNGRPMKFVRTEKKHGGEVKLHHFVDVETGEERIVEDLA